MTGAPAAKYISAQPAMISAGLAEIGLQRQHRRQDHRDDEGMSALPGGPFMS